MDISTLEDLIALGIHKSYSAAARKRYMSHTTLYRHIRALEAELGEPLILSTNPIMLTSAGKIVFEKAGNIISEAADMKRTLREHRSIVCGEVRLLDLTPQNDTMPLISRTLFRIRKDYPGIKLSLVEPSANLDVLTAIKKGLLDIGFRYHWYNQDTYRPQTDIHEELESEDVSRVMLKSLHFPVRFGIGTEHPLYDKGTGTLAEFAQYGIIQPANKIYQDSNDAFVAFLHREGLCPKLHYIAVNNLLSLWLSNPGPFAFLLTSEMLATQMLPPEFFDSVKVVAPVDDNYWMDVYAIVKKGAMDEAVLVTLAALESDLNQDGAAR
ncbi:MAG: LysR family transcriptional regulator [Coriobacteriaceae bacterium]|nr:LysR family transcriptional regulator [Coriobacteriaceae bacterium]